MEEINPSVPEKTQLDYRPKSKVIGSFFPEKTDYQDSAARGNIDIVPIEVFFKSGKIWIESMVKKRFFTYGQGNITRNIEKFFSK